jgi:predicted solute-binding protein
LGGGERERERQTDRQTDGGKSIVYILRGAEQQALIKIKTQVANNYYRNIPYQ